MSKFAKLTNLCIFSDSVIGKLLDIANNQHNWNTTYNHVDNTTKFVFTKLPSELESEILANILDQLKPFDPFIRLQITTGAGLGVHIDNGRTVSLLTPLTDDRSPTNFYEWAPNATKQLEDKLLVVDPGELVLAETIVAEKNKTYLFNNSEPHCAGPINGTRVTVNILFNGATFDQLVTLL